MSSELYDLCRNRQHEDALLHLDSLTAQGAVEQIFYKHEGGATALNHSSFFEHLEVSSRIAALSKLHPAQRCICAVVDSRDGHLPLHGAAHHSETGLS